MRSFLARHFRRHRSRIRLSNSTELLRTRRYSASTRTRSSSIRRSMPRQCSAKGPRQRAGVANAPTPRRSCGQLCGSALGLLPGALDLNALGLLYRRGALDPYLEHAVLELGADAALVRALRQRHASPERPVAALPHVVPGSLLLLLRLAHAANSQNPVVERDVHLLLLHTRELGPHHDVTVLLEHVEGRGPLRRHLTLLPAPGPGQGTEHLIEHPVHLALHVVETTERSQGHLTHLLLLTAPLGA